MKWNDSSEVNRIPHNEVFQYTFIKKVKKLYFYYYISNKTYLDRIKNNHILV